MPRYVILYHELTREQQQAAGRPSHWDLMFEWGATLRTWAVNEEPALGLTCAAQALADHRLAYLEYEGEVSGNRGRVRRWDAGEYAIEEQEPGHWTLILAGPRLPCRLTLVQELAPEVDTAHCWRVSVGAAPMRG